jgi:hypothetical protein
MLMGERLKDVPDYPNANTNRAITEPFVFNKKAVEDN